MIVRALCSCLGPNGIRYLPTRTKISQFSTTMATSKDVKVCVASHIPRLNEEILKRFPGGVNVTDLGIQNTEKGSPLNDEQIAVVKDAEVLVADTTFLVQYGLMYSLPNLKWLQSTWAGVDGLMQAADRSKPFPDYTVTKFAGFLGKHMCEYVVGHVIAHQRQFFDSKKDQERKIWDTVGKGQYRLLSEMSIAIIGAGDIGRDVARACKAFGMTVWGVVSTMPPVVSSPHIDHYRTKENLQEVFESCDYICNILPDTDYTKGFLDGDVLKHCAKKQSVFINIGRGTVVSEETLLRALEEKWLGHLILDVFQKEPLPTDSPLWTHPDVTISPHVSGVSQSYQIADVFYENYELYSKGKPLMYVVQWEAGY